MSLLDIFKQAPPSQPPVRACPSCGLTMGFSATEEGNILECPQWHSQIKEIGSGLIPVTTGPRDLITDEQTQHLLDLGETKYRDSRMKPQRGSRN